MLWDPESMTELSHESMRAREYDIEGVLVVLLAAWWLLVACCLPSAL